MKTFIRIISVMVLAHGFVQAQNVGESEAVSAAIRFVSELKQTNPLLKEK